MQVTTWLPVETQHTALCKSMTTAQWPGAPPFNQAAKSLRELKRANGHECCQ